MRPANLILVLALLLSFGCGGGDDGGGDDFADRMAEEHRDDEPVASPAAEAEPSGPVEAERVVYGELDGRQLSGYLARPEGDARGLPAIVVIHEWWGLNDNIEAMARKLAGEGYVALAVDLYGGEVAEDRGRARELMTEVSQDRAAAKKNLRRAHAYLEREYETDETGVIGWCFGGGWSLQTALLLPDELDAAVIYYGRLVTDRERLANLETPILGFFGSEDQGIPVATVREFEQALAELGKSADIHVYEGAGHAFANPSGTRYDAEAAADAWQKTLAFFEQHLGS